MLFPIGFLVLVLGLILCGVSTLQAGVLPRWCGVGFIIVGPTAFVPWEYSVVLVCGAKRRNPWTILR